jgi:tetratricopeptide (TPR) repeat protein
MSRGDETNEYLDLLTLAEAEPFFAQYDFGDWDEAARLWQRVVESNPVRGRYWLRLATACEKSGDHRRAVDAYERAYDLGESYPAELAYTIARLHSGMGQSEEALTWLERACALGYRRIREAGANEDLAPLRSDPRFRDMVGLIDRESMTRQEG